MKKFSLLFITTVAGILSSFAQTDHFTVTQFITGHTYDEKGREIISITAPGKPPANYRAPAAVYSRSAVTLSDVPAFSWSFGCSPTAASMAAGYYDNHGYPDVYTGPSNGGVIPMDNSVWGSVVIQGETRDLCPLSATMLNLDGRLTRGHVDDYWTVYGSNDPDPYIVNGWIEHAHDDCLADFMGTNQSAVGSSDGSTTFYYYVDGSPIYDYAGSEPEGRDGCHGMRLFYESRSYNTVENYTQLIFGNEGNILGFTFEQYMEEIDNGRPVLIQVAGHTMLGYGYDETGSLVYLHDTWDYQDHSMVWGGEYAGMAHWGVTVLRLQSDNPPPLADFTAEPVLVEAGDVVSFTDISTGNPGSWLWTFEGGIPETSTLQNPVIAYNTPGIYTVTLIASNANGYDSKTKTGYISVVAPFYCSANGNCDEYIAGVQFGTIYNVNTLCGDNSYTDFTYLSTDITPGLPYTLSVTNGNLNYPEDQCGAWIDWNQDFDFDDPDEYIPMDNSPGPGPYTAEITPPFTAIPGNTRLRIRVMYSGDLLPCGQASWGEVEDYTVNIIGPQAQKILNLTLFLESLFEPANQEMRKALDEYGEHFPGTTADQIVVSLAQASPPFAVLTESGYVNLNQDGTCIAAFPVSFNENYYLIISHRNSIRSWSATPVSFIDNTAYYNFSQAANQTFGGNAIQSGGKFCLYGGDVNQDGFVDTGDMTPIDNDASAFASGYLVTDANGDGFVDTADMTIVDNNAATFIGSVQP